MEKPVYRADLNRIETWIECQGIRINTQRYGDMEYSMCRALLEANPDLPDGRIEFHDENGTFCSFINSFHGGAKHGQPLSDDEKVKKERQKKPPKINLTPKQMEAFLIITKFPYKWDIEVASRTKNFMFDQQWVEETNNNLVRITKLGREVYQSAIQS